MLLLLSALAMLVFFNMSEIRMKKAFWIPYSLDQTPRLLKVSRLCGRGDKLDDWGQVSVSTS